MARRHDKLSDAERMKLYRARTSAGVIVLGIPVDEVAFTECLLSIRRLHPQAEDNRTALAIAAKRVLEDFIGCVTRNGSDPLAGVSIVQNQGKQARYEYDQPPGQSNLGRAGRRSA